MSDEQSNISKAPTRKTIQQMPVNCWKYTAPWAVTYRHGLPLIFKRYPYYDKSGGTAQMMIKKTNTGLILIDKNSVRNGAIKRIINLTASNNVSCNHQKFFPVRYVDEYSSVISRKEKELRFMKNRSINQNNLLVLRLLIVNALVLSVLSALFYSDGQFQQFAWAALLFIAASTVLSFALKNSKEEIETHANLIKALSQIDENIDGFNARFPVIYQAESPLAKKAESIERKSNFWAGFGFGIAAASLILLVFQVFSTYIH